MMTRISEGDRVILRYEVPQGPKGDPSGSFLLLVQDNNSDQFIYTVLFHTPDMASLDDEEFTIQWRGKLDRALEKFGDEVESWERDWARDPE